MSIPVENNTHIVFQCLVQSYCFAQRESHGRPWLFVDVVTVWTLFDKNPFLSAGWRLP
ncbi:TPA: hypothetical protein MM072_004451 [Klebsiella pneumoniae]|uniref:hypothetical protein n=1 Tax=Klebsiella pneumoniae TaxID=573 RepID=UPI001ACA3021|nr:hypothetical protein [Klebsiella pneumoniae]MBN8021956.1 hypothetical protein [Klebsiella pneumoniae]MCQ3845165.1 hypothetical protein [Klebsiella pneumoniae]MDZ2835277.1 hypothetical protein [Klebsiella pneumoniae]HBZ7908975.1 hypothetical protein [Klebsiella pneumoniae]